MSEERSHFIGLAAEMRNAIYMFLIAGHSISLMPGRQGVRLILPADIKALRSLSRQIHSEIGSWIYSLNEFQMVYRSLPIIIQRMKPERLHRIKAVVLGISLPAFPPEDADSANWLQKITAAMIGMQNEGDLRTISLRSRNGHAIAATENIASHLRVQLATVRVVIVPVNE
jgi:hypothetical protein